MFGSQSDNAAIFNQRLPTHGRVYSRGILCVSEELTNIRQPPGGETESMESKGEAESCGKFNWALNIRSDHSHLQRTKHMHTQTDTGQQPWHLHIQRKDSYVICIECFHAHKGCASVRLCVRECVKESIKAAR